MSVYSMGETISMDSVGEGESPFAGAVGEGESPFAGGAAGPNGLGTGPLGPISMWEANRQMEDAVKEVLAMQEVLDEYKNNIQQALKPKKIPMQLGVVLTTDDCPETLDQLEQKLY